LKKLKLTSKQIRYLRAQGHHLDPVAIIGQAGLTENVVSSIEDVLTAHELIKIKILSSTAANRHDIAQKVGEATGAAVVQVLGKTILLYRENEDRRLDQKIILPD
jgi:RNA-binding protein